MKLEHFFFFINIAFYVFIFGLIMYHIEIRWNPFGKMKCKLGIHRRTRKEVKKKVKTYHCTICSKAKNHPHLNIVQGGKKDFGTKFKW